MSLEQDFWQFMLDERALADAPSLRELRRRIERLEALVIEGDTMLATDLAVLQRVNPDAYREVAEKLENNKAILRRLETVAEQWPRGIDGRPADRRT